MSVVAKVSPNLYTRFKLERAISACCLVPRRHSARSIVRRMLASARTSFSHPLR